jgi:predicted ATP-grasp superfamily ATP-dependent carboligase
MKVLLGATAAVFLMASPASAQTGAASCQNYPAAPAVPDGAATSRTDITAARDAVAAWDADIQARVAACRAELQALNEAANAQDATRVATVNSMAAEIQEFTAAEAAGTAPQTARERRRDGGVMTGGRRN